MDVIVCEGEVEAFPTLQQLIAEPSGRFPTRDMDRDDPAGDPLYLRHHREAEGRHAQPWQRDLEHVCRDTTGRMSMKTE